MELVVGFVVELSCQNIIRHKDTKGIKVFRPPSTPSLDSAPSEMIGLALGFAC